MTTAHPLGPGSLSEAIEAANAHGGADTIGFNIPGGGVKRISVGDNGLPEITDPVTIDGYTQPGAKANTLAIGSDAVILIRIDGAPTGESPHHGLIIKAGDSVVRGLALTGFPNIFENYGETIFAGTAIILQEKGNNFIEGNFIGLSSDELLYGYNAIGLDMSSSKNTVGGTLPAQRNIIAHNFTAVVVGGSGNIVQGNYVGTDPSGAIAMGNGAAFLIDGTTAEIGGRVPEAANVISGNQIGIYIAYSGAENIIQGNLIGTDATGLVNVGNTTSVTITGSHNLIGGLAPGAGNRILFEIFGVQVKSIDDHPAVGNSILSNCLSASSGLIDLDDGQGFDFASTRNDLGDGDTGPNNLQNFPIITSTTFLPDRTTVRGGLNSTPSTTFTLQFFSQPFAQGEATFLDTETITTNAAGVAYFAFDLQPLSSDLLVTATATDPDGNTSEFPYQYAVQVANISTRGQVGTDDNILISGFVVHRPLGGPTDSTKKVLLRALGPSLAVDGVPLAGRLDNPALELHDGSGALLATNDDWRSDQEAEITDTGTAPSSDAEAALITNLPDGSYTVQVRGVDGTVGLGVTEVYDLEPLDPINEGTSERLVNISTRGLVGAGDDALIGGLIVRGDDAENVLIRAIGPDLIGSVPNALEDPTLEVRDGSGALLASNDNWRDEQEAEIAATGVAPNDDRDSAVLFTLIPGSYTAIVRGKADSTGVGLVEVYDLNFGH